MLLSRSILYDVKLVSFVRQRNECSFFLNKCSFLCIVLITKQFEQETTIALTTIKLAKVFLQMILLTQ